MSATASSRRRGGLAEPMSGPEGVFQSCFDLRWHFNPAAASAAGRRSQDGRLGTFDADSIRAHLAASKSLTGALEALEVDDAETEIDQTALLNDLRGTIHRFEREQPHVRNPSFWLSHLYQGLYTLLNRGWDPPGERAVALVERLRATPLFLAAALETLKHPAPILVQTAAAMLDSGDRLIGQAAAACRPDYPGPPEEVDQAAAGARVALARLKFALDADMASSTDEQAFAIGEEQFNRRLYFEHAVNHTAPELWRFGMHLVEEVEAELAVMARAMDPARSWREQIERLREAAPVQGDRVAAYRAAINRARGFVEQHGLVSIPDGNLLVEPTPDFLRPMIPFAGYWPPGPYAPDRTGWFYVTIGDGGGSLGRSEHELVGTALHEGYPGHHLHNLTMQASTSEVRRVIWSPLTVEGWALYCEEMMGEEGFYQEPGQRLFQRMHLLWRAVRVLLDIGLHTRGMSPSSARLFLLDRIPIQPNEAEAEVRRSCAWPSYHVCYALGWREIRQLRADFRARAGDAYRLRAFHDAFLKYGGLPVSYARWGMGLPEG